MINLHAGGFVTGSGSLVEAIPIASLTRSTVIAVDYRLAPEHHYPAPIDDAVTVYKEALNHHAPSEIGIYGTSAGAFLTAQTIMRLQRDSCRSPGVPACSQVAVISPISVTAPPYSTSAVSAATNYTPMAIRTAMPPSIWPTLIPTILSSRRFGAT